MLLNRLSAISARQLPQTRRLMAQSAPDRIPIVADPFGPGYLKKMLRRQDGIPQESRAGSEYVHVSSLLDLCKRKYVLAQDDPSKLSERVTGGHKVMWALGRAAEKHVRQGLIADRGRFGILGRWQCMCKKHTHEGLFSPAYRACTECGTLPDNYAELVLRDEVSKVTGSMDLGMYVGDEVLPIEIKSINAEGWDALDEANPLGAHPDHQFQVHSYRKLLGINGYRVMPVGAVIYVKKEFKWGDPYKEFHVPLSNMTGVAIDNAWGDARELAEARRGGRLPPRVRCKSENDPRAKGCPMLATCWMRST